MYEHQKGRNPMKPSPIMPAPDNWFVTPARNCPGRPLTCRDTLPEPADHCYLSMALVDTAIDGLLAGLTQAAVVAATGITPAVVATLAHNVVEWRGPGPSDYVPKEPATPNHRLAPPRLPTVPAGARRVAEHRCPGCGQTTTVDPCLLCLIRGSQKSSLDLSALNSP